MSIRNLIWLTTACLLLFPFLAEGQQYVQSGQIQLADPAISAESTFFEKQTAVTIYLDVPDVLICYTLDGSVPTRDDRRYTAPIVFTESTQVRARAFHADFKASEVAVLQVFRLADVAATSITFNREPAEQYAGGGAESLINRQKGSFDFRDGQWLGFSTDSLLVRLEFDEVGAADQLVLSLLEDTNSWIFLPLSVSVTADDQVIASWQGQNPRSDQRSFQYISIELPETVKVEEVYVQITMGSIPDWHLGKGQMPWLFVDEILTLKH